MRKNRDNKLIGTSLFAALAASLCCIAPLLTLIVGVSGLASAFTWLEPLRPYLIGLTIVTLGYAWYQKFKPNYEIDCDCDTDEKQLFLQSKKFLLLVTLFAVLMLAFPYYNSAIFSSNKDTAEILKMDLTTVNLQIDGMTCEGCEINVTNYAEAAGAEDVVVDHKTGKANVRFDKNKTNIDSIITSVKRLGYTVTKGSNIN